MGHSESIVDSSVTLERVPHEEVTAGLGAEPAQTPVANWPLNRQGAITPSTLARIAGNIAANMGDELMTDEEMRDIARKSVKLARLIVDEVKSQEG